MEGLSISPKFLSELEESRNLSHEAFVAACGLTDDRYAALMNGETPTGMEIIRIVAGFNLSDGVPVVLRSQELVA